MDQHQLSEGPLLDEKGELCEAGYAFSLVKKYDRNAIKVPKHRIKEWDYYYIGNAEFGLALTIDDNGYMGLGAATWMEFPDVHIHKSHMYAFPMGKGKLPASSKEGDTHYSNKKGVVLSFCHSGEGKRRLTGYWPKFDKEGHDLHFDITLTETSPNSMVIATPFHKKGHFYYNQKINNMKANGYAKLGEKMLDFSSCYGVLDWGRGVWTRKNTWYWSSLNSELKGQPFGWNLGYGFGNTNAASENMVFYGDKAYKLEEVRFDIPIGKNGKDDFMSPWTIRSSDGRIKASFRPVYNRHEKASAIIISQNANQVFGLFTGTLFLDGLRLDFEGLPGFAEKVSNRW